MDTPDLDEDPSTAGGDIDDLLRRVAKAPPREPFRHPVSGDRWGRRGRYRVEQCIGKGGMGSVYLASDLLLDRLVALKVLHRVPEIETADDRGAALREARAAAQVEHHRIARVYDVGEHQGTPFVAMEFIRGLTLRRWMQGRTAGANEVLTIGVQIAEGLDALHRRGVVHRDLKPENVMLTEDGSVKLLDLGLAKRRVGRDADGSGRHASESKLRAELRVGTPGYMAPEQYTDSQVDARADVFALGVLLYELVAQARPFRGDSLAEVARATLREAPSFASERWRAVPPALRWIVESALAKDPASRLAHARGFLEALEPLVTTPGRISSNPLAATIDLEHAPTIAVPSGSSLLRRHETRARSMVGLVVVTAAAVIGAGAALATDRAPSASVSSMAWVPAGMVGFHGGHFRMGREAAELEAECARLKAPCPKALMAIEAPPAEATQGAFAIDAHEVTVADFARFLTRTGSRLRVDVDPDDGSQRYVRFASGVHAGELVADLWKGEAGITYDVGGYSVRQGAEALPMRLVSWLGANLYCRGLGEARLPTEAEWEYAAHGKTARRFPWGDDPPRCDGVVLPIDGRVPVAGECSPRTGPVAVGTSTEDVTPEGVQDLGGNVAEWTDTKLRALKAAAVARASTPADEGPHDVDDSMTVRGGSYHESLLARTTARTRLQRGGAAEDVGFRCAMAPAER